MEEVVLGAAVVVGAAVVADVVVSEDVVVADVVCAVVVAERAFIKVSIKRDVH